MGLAATGDDGVKAIVKQCYSAATRTYNSLADVRKAVKADRANTAVCLDGNVMLLQVPQNACSFAAYVGIVSGMIKTAMGSAALVCVVFDDPACLTLAKREEQMKRDAARKKREPMCSVDIVAHPTTDDYGVPDLMATPDCHAVVGCRASRQRFFDETGKQVLAVLQRSIDSWAQDGHRAVVLLDGLDPRGADRPVGAPRETAIFGSCAETAALFQRDFDIGEGDLKLAWFEERVRQLTAEGTLQMELHLTVTIDTDSVPITLLEQARRNCAPPQHDVKGCLCMRERDQKREFGEDQGSASYFVVDYANLLEMMQTHLWGLPRNRLDLLPSPEQQRAATALMCAGWALSGCDFVKLPGLKASMVMDALPSMLKASPGLVDSFASAWSGDRTAIKSVTPVLKRLVLLCAGNYEEEPRARKATVASMREHDHRTLLRAAWVMSYWHLNEMKGDLSDFGFGPVYQGQVFGVEPEGVAKAPRLKASKARAVDALASAPVLCSTDLSAFEYGAGEAGSSTA
jgi:hypothetical protein